MLTRSLIVAASLAAGALAQNCSDSVTVQSQSDLDALAGCQKYEGDITIEGEAGVLTLNGVQQIDGTLFINNATALSSFSAPVLTNISKSFHLFSLTVLNTLSAPQLTKVGKIEFQTLPQLEELQFNAGIQEANEVVISDTRLNSLSGLNLSAIQTFNINNNKNIQDITVAISSVSNALDISFNSEKVNVSLPNLEWANNATFRFCASVDVPKLKSVNQSLGFINNTIYSISANNLEKIGGSLSFVSNSKLSNLSFPSLSQIGGGFQVANNTNLKVIAGFPKVSKVGGAIDFVGNFSQALLPSLEDVEGGVVVDSSASLNCSSFDTAHQNGDIHGDKYVCKGAQTTVSELLSGGSSKTAGGSGSGDSSASATGSGSDSGSSGSSSKSSKNGAVPAAQAGGLLGGLFVLFQLI